MVCASPGISLAPVASLLAYVSGGVYAIQSASRASGEAAAAGSSESGRAPRPMVIEPPLRALSLEGSSPWQAESSAAASSAPSASCARLRPAPPAWPRATCGSGGRRASGKGHALRDLRLGQSFLEPHPEDL